MGSTRGDDTFKGSGRFADTCRHEISVEGAGEGTDSTPADCEKGKLTVEPDEQQALTYLNRERKVFWAGLCLFPSSYPARYFRNEGFSLTGKEIELPWQPRPQHLFMYIGFDVRLAKRFNRSGKFFFSQNCVVGRYGTGCGFPIRNLEGQKNARWKYRNLPLPSIHWHAHSPPITQFLLPFSIGLSLPEFLEFISGFFCLYIYRDRKPSQHLTVGLAWGSPQ